MKKAYLLLAILLVLAVAVVAAVDFSGTWVFNATKSDQPPAGGGGGRGGGMGGGDITIKQEGIVLTVSRMMGQNPMDTNYTMDGAEHTNTTQQGDMKYKATLAGNSVHITGTQTTQRGDRPIDQTYTLSDDGKTLTSTAVSQGQNGPTTRKTVYDKK